VVEQLIGYIFQALVNRTLAEPLRLVLKDTYTGFGHLASQHIAVAKPVHLVPNPCEFWICTKAR
jgi:hypothetical protein